MRHLKYRFHSLRRRLPKTEDLNTYTYLEKRDSKGKIEWAQVGVLENLEYINGVILS